MNYSHAYHAGNFADVFKHVVLVMMVQALRKKESPFCYLDTHAGTGQYDLFSEAAQKTGEAKDGIGRILRKQNIPEAVLDYVTAVREMGGASDVEEMPRYYPGSPRLVRHFLRPQDRMVLTELREEDALALKQEFHGDAQVGVHHTDGYGALKAFLPPKENRGLVLIDPPFERPDEFRAAADALTAAWQRWPRGVYAFWYPIKDRPPIDKFERIIKASGIQKVLVAELCLLPDTRGASLNGCGMLLINPPWQMDEALRGVLAWLWPRLRTGELGKTRVEWLVPE